jgi:hypothetical protein
MAQVDSENSTAMPAVSTRRRFLSQAAAVTAGGAAFGVALPLPGSAAHGGQAPDPILAADAELIALGQKISELRVLERSANAEVDRYSDEYDAIEPPKPAVLLWRPTDPISMPPLIAEGRNTWWVNMRFTLEEEEYGLRPGLPPPGHDGFGYFTEAEMERRAEALDAWRAWQRDLDQARQESGLADAEDKADAISAEMGDLYRQMLKLKPQTLEGFQALALATIENCWGDEIPAPREVSDEQGVALLISALTGVPIESGDATDPIFATIEAHAKASAALWALHEESLAVGPENAGHLQIEAAVAAELDAAKALIDTAPNTQIGLRALEAHLREDRHRSARGFIKRTHTTETGRTYTSSNWELENVDWLIAKRAAEIANAG